MVNMIFFFFFQAEDGIRDSSVTGVQTCALPIYDEADQMIAETAVLSDLIGTIYDTALDRALWSDVLRRSAEFVGGSASSLYSKNTARKTGNKFLCWSPRFDAAALPSYFEEYVRIDP